MVLSGSTLSMYTSFMHRCSMNPTLPTTSDFPNFFNSKKYYHRWKCGSIPKYALKRWMKEEILVMALGKRFTRSIG